MSIKLLCALITPLSCTARTGVQIQDYQCAAALLMADKQSKLPIPRVAPAHKIKTGKRKKTDDDNKKAKKKELDRPRNKMRVNIGAAFPRWRELRVLKGLKTNAELATFLLDK